MRRRALLSAAVILGLATLPALADDPGTKARRLHARAIVVDTHVDAPYRLEKKWADVGERGATPHFDIPRALEGGLTAPFLAIYVPAFYAETGGAAREALDLIDLVARAIDGNAKELRRAASAADIRQAKRDGKIAVLMGIEGGHAIEDSLGALRQFYRLGVRYMTLTHVNSNHWADSSGKFYVPGFDPAEFQLHHGLTDFGKAVVREMNRIGMMVDVSHVSDETIDAVLLTSRAPIFASHSSCRALCDIPRNLTDDQIRRIAAKGGVVMINVSSYFIDPKVVEADRAERDRLTPEYLKIKQDLANDPKKRDEAIGKLFDTLTRHRSVWTRVADHIEHVIQVAGPGAVGLGTDFDGIQDPPEGLEDVSKLPAITTELLRRGYSEDVVRGVLGENLLRFFARVEEVSRGLADELPSISTTQPGATYRDGSLRRWLTLSS